MCVCAQTCLTLCDPVVCSLPGSSVYGIIQTRTVEWVAISSSRESSDPGIEPESLMSAALAGRFFTTSATLEALIAWEEESNTTNPHNWGGWTGEEKYTSPTPLSKSLLSDALSLSHPLAPPHQWRDKPVLLALTGSSPKGFILTPFQVSIETATFCFSTPPILPLPLWVHPCMYLVFFFFFMFMCQEWRSEKGNKTHCSLFQCTATGKHFTAHPLPCNFYCLAADKEASIDTQDRCTMSSWWNFFCLTL